jgi:hypothetical protein
MRVSTEQLSRAIAGVSHTLEAHFDLRVAGALKVDLKFTFKLAFIVVSRTGF